MKCQGLNRFSVSSQVLPFHKGRALAVTGSSFIEHVVVVCFGEETAAVHDALAGRIQSLSSGCF